MTDQFWLPRLIAEKDALDKRIMDLLGFYDKVDFGKLPKNEKMLMLKQGIAMEEYSKILGERIYRFRYKQKQEQEHG